MRTAACTIFAGLLALALCAGATQHVPVESRAGKEMPKAMVIGIVGGFVHQDDRVHGVVQFADRIRRELPVGAFVAVFENHHWREARTEIERRLDSDHDGSLSDLEKQSARIVLFGHSWGGSETVHLAKELGKDGIPILLTIQVDSVHKRGEEDSVIPPNVKQAINFYQSDGWLHGRKEIRAADPQRTQILGNIRLEYKPGACPGYPWYNRWFTKPHCAIEVDDQVWDRADTLINSRLSIHSLPDSSIPEPRGMGRAQTEIDASGDQN
ncbi:MAG TPA: hypothetical protein VL128_16065 [Candidatus Eisenbacteria bacterium]|nr:hypothetical protein [Candidatus Eisenbacteria bacterium]